MRSTSSHISALPSLPFNYDDLGAVLSSGDVDRCASSGESASENVSKCISESHGTICPIGMTHYYKGVSPLFFANSFSRVLYIGYHVGRLRNLPRDCSVQPQVEDLSCWALISTPDTTVSVRIEFSSKAQQLISKPFFSGRWVIKNLSSPLPNIAQKRISNSQESIYWRAVVVRVALDHSSPLLGAVIAPLLPPSLSFEGDRG